MTAPFLAGLYEMPHSDLLHQPSTLGAVMTDTDERQDGIVRLPSPRRQVAKIYLVR